MLEGTLLTLDGIVALVGVALGCLSYWAESMLDAPGAWSGLGYIPLILFIVGVVAIAGALFIP